MNRPHNKLEALSDYTEAFRDLVNDRVGLHSKHSPSKLLRLSNEDDWSFICVAMDILGDSSLALQNFARFSLDGPSRYEDTGECYLRLYGLLGAAYVQQQAAFKLYKLMNCPNPRDVKVELDSLDLRKLRHQLASHSLDYSDFDGTGGKAFVPVRIELGGHKCTVTENRGDGWATYDLKDALNKHCDVMVSIMDRIYEKTFRTLFKTQRTRLEKYQQRLDDLRMVRDGMLVIRIPSDEGGGVTRILIVPKKVEGVAR